MDDRVPMAENLLELGKVLDGPDRNHWTAGLVILWISQIKSFRELTRRLEEAV